MTKNSNKGFSLIDVIIAVAVLSLLVTPILLQLIQTLNTSAEAKERQYAVDNAQYVLEYFQAENFENPSDNTTEDDDNKIKIDSKMPMTTENVILYKLDASNVLVFADTDEAHSTFSYSVKGYQLSNAKFGREKNEYSRVVMINDLVNKIKSEQFQLINVNDPSTPQAKIDAINALKGTHQSEWTDANLKWEVDSEGRCVAIKRVDTGNGATYDYVVAAIVEDSPYTYTDPNSVAVGSARNIKDAADGGQDVIIPGSVSDFDRTAYMTYFGDQMITFQSEAYERWQAAVFGDDYETIDINSAKNSLPLRFTTISVTKPDPDNKPNEYNVKCDVHYYFKYHVTADISVSDPDILSFSVYDQTFTADHVPNVYMYYEPFVMQKSYSSTTDFIYAPADYIGVYNDYCCKDSKLYLIKPDQNQLRLVKWKAGGNGDTLNEDTAQIYADGTDKFAYYSNIREGVLLPVQIFVVDLDDNLTHPTSFNDDGTPKKNESDNYESTCSGSEVPPMKVISNMTVNSASGTDNSFLNLARFDYSLDAAHTTTSSSSCGGVFFNLPANDDADSKNLLYGTMNATEKDLLNTNISNGNTLVSYLLNQNLLYNFTSEFGVHKVTSTKMYGGNPRDNQTKNYLEADQDYIISIDKDTDNKMRLFSATVKLQDIDKDSVVITFSSSKEADE